MGNNQMSFSLLVPAAGRGSRMKSANTPKVLVPFKGQALIDWAMSRFLHQAEDVYCIAVNLLLIKGTLNLNLIGSAIKHGDAPWIVLGPVLVQPVPFPSPV